MRIRLQTNDIKGASISGRSVLMRRNVDAEARFQSSTSIPCKELTESEFGRRNAFADT